MHGGKPLVAHDFVGVVGDAVFVQILVLLRLQTGFIVENHRHAVIYDSLPAQHILKLRCRDVDVGKDLGVGLPADDRAGAATGERLLLQTAHVFALFEIQMVVEAVAVDIGGHPLAGVLGGAQTQTVQTQAEVIVAAALAVFAAGVQLAEDQLPVPAFLDLIVIYRNAAPEVLDLDDVFGEKGDIDAVAVTVARLVNGVGHDFKNGMGAPFHTVRAKDDRRALAHTVGAFELAYGFVSVFLLFFRHSSPCFAAFFYPQSGCSPAYFAHTFVLNHKIGGLVKFYSYYITTYGCISRGKFQSLSFPQVQSSKRLRSPSSTVQYSSPRS